MAKVLADTRNISDEKWLKHRREGIGSSDAAAVCGLNTWRSAFAVYLDKVGELPEQEETAAMRFGTLLEPIVAEEFSRVTGLKVRRRNAILQHPLHHFMLANIDREVVGERALLECKTTSAWNRDQWADGAVPEQYVIQVQHQLSVTGYDKAYVACLLGGQQFEVREIERDEEIISQLIEIERDFWENHVVPRIPPDVDGSDQTEAILKRLYPQGQPDKETILPEALATALRQYSIAKAEKRVAETRMKEAQNKIQEAMADAEIAYLPGLDEPVVTWKTFKRRNVDTERLKEDGLYDTYAKPSIYRKFDVKEAVLNG